jgi:hypothetical protein
MTWPQTKRAVCPSFDELVTALRVEHSEMTLELVDGEADAWSELLLAHADGTEIAVIERNVVEGGSLGTDEVAELIEAVADCRPASASRWLSTFLPAVSTVYA